MLRKKNAVELKSQSARIREYSAGLLGPGQVHRAITAVTLRWEYTLCRQLTLQPLVDEIQVTIGVGERKVAIASVARSCVIRHDATECHNLGVPDWCDTQIGKSIARCYTSRAE